MMLVCASDDKAVLSRKCNKNQEHASKFHPSPLLVRLIVLQLLQEHKTAAIKSRPSLIVLSKNSPQLVSCPGRHNNRIITIKILLTKTRPNGKPTMLHRLWRNNNRHQLLSQQHRLLPMLTMNNSSVTPIIMASLLHDSIMVHGLRQLVHQIPMASIQTVSPQRQLPQRRPPLQPQSRMKPLVTPVYEKSQIFPLG